MKHFLIICLFCAIFSLIPAAFGFSQDVQEGNATWYKTDSLNLNASHARLPLGTRLKVTNLENNKSVYVSVTNRIPSSPARILDVSQEAARILEMADTGYTAIRYEVSTGLSPEPAAVETPAADAEPAPAPAPEIAAVPNTGEDEIPDYNIDPDMPVVETDSETEPEPPVPQAPVRTAIPPVQPSPRRPAPPAASAPVSPPLQGEPSITAEARIEPPPRPLPPEAFHDSPPPRKPAPAAADSGVQDLTIKVIVTVNGQEHTVEIPVTQPAAAPAASPAAAPVPVLPPASGPSVKIVPRMPDPQNGRIYRVQVGAFSSQVFAQECYDKVKTTGLSPAFERYGNLHRVVISGVKAAEMPQIAQRLGAAGFKEAWAREEN